MAIESAVRHQPAPWIILGPVLLASLLSAGLALLAVLGAPPWEPAAGMAGQPAAGPPAGGQRPNPPPRSSAPTPAITSSAVVPLGAPAPGAAYHPGSSTARHTAAYQRSLLYSGMFGLAIAIMGALMVGRRRRMW